MLLISQANVTFTQNDVALSAEEAIRAAGITKPLRREQFIAGRMLLRQVLARALGGCPEDWVLDAVVGAPPRVKGRPDLHLSVSHSGEWVAAALADRPLGIDIERLGARPNPQRFARWVCSPDEFERWTALDALAADDALIGHWTRKEAWLKCAGGEVLLTRMHRLQAESVSPEHAEGRTFRVGDAAMLSVCCARVCEMRIDDATSALLQPDSAWRLVDQAEVSPMLDIQVE